MALVLPSWRVWTVLACAAAGPAAAGWLAEVTADESCDAELLVALHRKIEPTVREISEVHYNFTGSRHYEVVEIISLFQADRLCRSALNVIESLRLALCVLVCPKRFAPPGTQERAELPGSLRFVEHTERYFADVRYVANAGFAEGSDDEEEARNAWDGAANELIEVAKRLEHWVEQGLQQEQRIYVDVYAQIEPLIKRVLDTTLDFLRSLTEDMSTLFRAPNYVAIDMLPPGERHFSPAQTAKTSVNVYTTIQGNQALNPALINMLHRPPAALPQPSFFHTHRECQAVARPLGLRTTPREFEDMPWAHTDVIGVHRRQPSPLQLLQAISRHSRLSNLFISAQLASFLLTPTPKCGSHLTLYDPSYCLLDQQWGGYFFHLNPLPPYNLTIVYAGKATGPGAIMPLTDVHSIHVESRDTQWSSLVSTFKSVNHHSPDLFFLSPLVGNCQLVDRLLGSGTVKPKLVYLPFNPLVPPPLEDVPDYFTWWGENSEEFVKQLMAGVTRGDEGQAPRLPITMSMWLGQCSLASGAAVMGRHGYALLHVEHTFAVFIWGPLVSILANTGDSSAGDVVGKAGSSHGSASAELWVEDARKGKHDNGLRNAWLTGWLCSPLSRYVFDLEVLQHLAVEPATQALYDGGDSVSATETYGGPLSRAAARRYAATVTQEAPTMRYFLERTNSGQPRGRCVEGICDCFHPYRGPLCQYEDVPSVPQKVKACIHYITADTERDLQDISRSLSSLWARFNRHYDHPIVVFHDGLSAASRWRIIDASENRVWLVLLPNFREIPAEWAEAAHEGARDFSVGYRAMIRWRSGPVFLEPALAGFDYAMTLDTDSYFPNDVGADPFEFVHNEGLVAAFPHLGRESASVVVNFMHYFLLYCRLKGLHPRRTEMLVSLIEKNFKWYQQCMMLDIEILRLDWFRGDRYQDFFHYMDSTGGFWIHRWGNNPFRTFAVALLLEDADVKSLTMPYAHQDYCSCGAGGPSCTWDAEIKAFHCLETTQPPPPRLSAESLDEGLLDLQPWRGTPRQKRKFNPAAIHEFVAEHNPF